VRKSYESIKSALLNDCIIFSKGEEQIAPTLVSSHPELFSLLSILLRYEFHTLFQQCHKILLLTFECMNFYLLNLAAETHKYP